MAESEEAGEDTEQETKRPSKKAGKKQDDEKRKNKKTKKTKKTKKMKDKAKKLHCTRVIVDCWGSKRVWPRDWKEAQVWTKLPRPEELTNGRPPWNDCTDVPCDVCGAHSRYFCGCQSMCNKKNGLQDHCGFYKRYDSCMKNSYSWCSSNEPESTCCCPFYNDWFSNMRCKSQEKKIQKREAKIKAREEEEEAAAKARRTKSAKTK